VTRPLTATTVGELPCVMTTVRPRLPFCFGMREICTHIDKQIQQAQQAQRAQPQGDIVCQCGDSAQDIPLQNPGMEGLGSTCMTYKHHLLCVLCVLCVTLGHQVCLRGSCCSHAAKDMPIPYDLSSRHGQLMGEMLQAQATHTQGDLSDV
jgi:hypothetical protein